MTTENVDEKKLRTDQEVANSEESGEYDATQTTKEKRILIVEDSEYKYREVVVLLNKYNLINYVHTTTIGKSFFECMKGEQPVDIIILDMQFPNSLNEPINPNAGIKFIYKLEWNYRHERLKEIPHIIGFSSEDFYNGSKELPKEFIGQGDTIYKVEEILKKILCL